MVKQKERGKVSSDDIRAPFTPASLVASEAIYSFP